MSITDFRVRLPQELRPPEGERPPEYTAQYDSVLGVSATRDRDLEELCQDMREAGIDRAVVHAEYELGDPADALNEAVAALVDEQPDRFTGFGTVSLEHLRPMRVVAQTRRARDLGLVGINIQPSFFGMPIDEANLYPLYATASELGMIVAVHTGVNYTSTFPIANDHPLQLDRVACAFPELPLVACHAGWPWVAELAAVMRKHQTVYAEFGGLAPVYVGGDDTGWSPMRRLMDSVLARQVLFGTDWPVFPMERAVREWEQMTLKDSTRRALFLDNASRLLASHAG